MGRLLVAAGEHVYLLDLASGGEEPVAALPIERPLMRANDGRVDAAGRFWVGTMIDDVHAPERFRGGRLFCVHPDGRVEDAGIEAELPNGIAWSPDGLRMYLNDSTARVTRCFDFDPQSGRLSHDRPLLVHPDDDGLPDGLCADAEGYVWSGQWNGWNIKRISPSGVVVDRIPTPVQRPSSVTFFGPQLRRLAFTSAANGFRTSDFLAAPNAGSLFELSVSAAGQAEHFFSV
jgi:sugar lactone lactonase YvrE